MNISCRCSLSQVRGRCTCRCSSDDRTVPSTSSVTGSATKTDSGTCLANFGLVGERLNQIHSNCWHSKKNDDFTNATQPKNTNKLSFKQVLAIHFDMLF